MSPQRCLQQLQSCGSTYRRRGRFTPEEHKRITAAFASLSQNLGLVDPQTRTSSYFRHRVCQAFLRDIEQIGGRDLVVLCAAALGLTQIGKMTKGQRTELTDLIISRQSEIESAGLAAIWEEPQPLGLAGSGEQADQPARIHTSSTSTTSSSPHVPLSESRVAAASPVHGILRNAPVRNSTRELLAEFLVTREGPLAPVAAAFAIAIHRAGCIVRPGPPRHPRIGGPAAIPFLLPSRDCWYQGRPPDEDSYMNDLLLNMGGSQTFHRGEQRSPADKPNYWSVLRQLSNPDPRHTSCIMNVPSKLQLLRIPDILRAAPLPCNAANLLTLTDVTPKYYYVDLQMDLGSATITGTAGGGEKLIGLYPPTPRNLAVFSSQKAFVDTHAHLERGIFMALTSEECCFIPAGWLHTLYTTSGGPTAVLKWPTSECF
ncbi:hypothetical protein CSUB01_12236 [Colletotrichum sublineola]|uniref:JmjC domain-containing protein n=1 Tax=Colletotrichum sublineola TaxID=1173701 RepID=A0A066XLQ8_COLSU|nr:hypothetical protein CSUB01_12236 [Colletotrichum sublineola]